MADKKPDFARGDVINEKYEVVERLEETPVGTSYRVKHIKSGKNVRLTVLDPSFANAEHQNELITAFKAARSIEHAGLLKLGELGDHRGVAYYTYEDFEAQTLHELLQEYRIEGRQVGLQDAAQILIAVLEALQAVHDSGHLYRALRPEHVLVQTKYVGPRKNLVVRIKLLHAALWDLVASGALAEEEFTRSDALYLAPELKGFEPVVTPRSDVYGAGCLFYEMLTGTAPSGTFQRPTSVRPELPHHVDDITELALSPAPEDRYQTATDLADDVRRIFQEPDVTTHERRPLVTPLWWGLGLVAVLALAVLLFQLRSDPAEAARAADATLRSTVVAAYPPDPTAYEAIRAKHPPNMIYVPAGPYLPGRLPAEFDAPAIEPQAHIEELPAFLVDAFEYPNLKGAVPEYGLTWTEADEKCRAAGKRLCTAAEWEKACKGPNSAAYGYGDAYDAASCGSGVEERGYPSGSKDACHSRWGAFDLSGNFREWTATTAPGKDADSKRIVKGGLRHDPQRGSRCAYSVAEAVGLKEASTSFRCCRDEDAPPVPDPAADVAPPP